MKFDKSRCYSALNADELRAGDKVIVGNCVKQLKSRIESNIVEEIKQLFGEQEPARFDVGEDKLYALAYLVKRKENCANCSHSCKSINPCLRYEPKTDTPELISLGNGQYVERKHTDCNHCEEAKKAYACAMTNVCPNKHYRPFKDTDELIKVWCEKGGKWQKRELTLPYIWVKYKDDDSDRGRLIISYSNNGCSVIDVDEIKVMLWSNLFEEYTFLDGSPCGVEE